MHAELYYNYSDKSYTLINSEEKIYHIYPYGDGYANKFIGKGAGYRNQIQGIKLKEIPNKIKRIFFSLNKKSD